jgi:hypothetical protein
MSVVGQFLVRANQDLAKGNSFIETKEWTVPYVTALRHYGDWRCCGSRCQLRCKPTAASWCGNGAGLQDAKQYGCPDRTDRRNLAESFPGLVFLGLSQQLPPHFLTYRPQRIKLLVVKLRQRTPGSPIFPSHSARWRAA